MIDIRLPQINGASEREQLGQIRSYLFQLAEQLQFALKDVDTTQANVVSLNAKSLVSSVPSRAKIIDPDPQNTFNSIKALIIKSAEIVDAYYEEINKRLVGVYVAESDFGSYKEETSQDVVENSTNINRTFNHAQEIKTGVDKSLDVLSGEIGQVDSKVDGVESALAADITTLKKEVQTLNLSLAEVTANIKTGLLYYDDNGIPVYGLEVGQRNTIDGAEVFNKFARFTAGRLTFYDHNGAEVAYISDYRLYIFNVEITGIYKIGGLVDSVMASGDVVEKWVGRS